MRLSTVLSNKLHRGGFYSPFSSIASVHKQLLLSWIFLGYITNFFQICPKLAGCKELAERFEPIGNREVFSIKIYIPVYFVPEHSF